MMFDNVTLFTAAKAYDMTTDFQKLLKSRTVDGELVGSCFASGKTFAIERYPVRRPDRNLLMALRIYHTIQNSGVQCTNTVVIRNLVLKGLWMAKEGMTKGLPRKGRPCTTKCPRRATGALRRTERGTWHCRGARRCCKRGTTSRNGTRTDG